MVHIVFLYYLEGNSLGKQHPWYSGRAFLYFKRLNEMKWKGFISIYKWFWPFMYLKPLSRVPFEYETMKCYGKTIYHIYIWLYTRSSLLKTYIPRYVFKQFSMHYLMPLEVLIYLYKCAPGMYISFLILLFFFLNAFSSFSSPDWCDIGFYLYLLPPNYTD
jgi:hypothetical protein